MGLGLDGSVLDRVQMWDLAWVRSVLCMYPYHNRTVVVVLVVVMAVMRPAVVPRLIVLYGVGWSLYGE